MLFITLKVYFLAVYENSKSCVLDIRVASIFRLVQEENYYQQCQRITYTICGFNIIIFVVCFIKRKISEPIFLDFRIPLILLTNRCHLLMIMYDLQDIKHYEKLKKLYSIKKKSDDSPMETPTDAVIVDVVMEPMET